MKFVLLVWRCQCGQLLFLNFTTEASSSHQQKGSMQFISFSCAHGLNSEQNGQCSDVYVTTVIYLTLLLVWAGAAIKGWPTSPLLLLLCSESLMHDSTLMVAYLQEQVQELVLPELLSSSSGPYTGFQKRRSHYWVAKFHVNRIKAIPQ